MRMRSFQTFILFISLFLITVVSEAKSTPLQSLENDTLRVGLVLSGGGAKGIAHVGVIEALEEAGVRIDYITGTSMGALVGGLYSIGYTTEQLAEIVHSSDFNDFFQDRKQRMYTSNYEKLTDERTLVSFPMSRRGISLPPGVITGQKIYTFFSRLAWHVSTERDFDNFPIPFAAIATDLETGEAAVFRSGYLPDALRASMSIPSIFTPIEIDDRIYVDGGLIRNLPVQDAIDMGANYIIAVDAGSKLEDRTGLQSLTAILNQTISFRIRDNVEAQRKLADYYVDIEDVRIFSTNDFGEAEALLNIGRNAGREHLDAFRQIAANQNRKPTARKAVPLPELISIDQVTIEGNTIYDDYVILGLLEFLPGSKIHPDLIEERLSQLYSSQYIDNVHYRIEQFEDDNILHITIIENLQNRFRLGTRYESQTKSSILLSANFQNVIQPGSVTRLEARLGERLNFKAEQSFFTAFDSRSALLASVEYLSEKVDWYSENEIVGRHSNKTFRGEISWANYFSTNNLISFGLRKDFTNYSSQINPEEVRSSPDDHHALFMRYMRDNLNRKAFTKRGRKMVVQSFISDPVIFSPISFTASEFHYQNNFQITDFLTFKNTFWAVYTTGRDLPWGYWPSPNRYDPINDYIRFGGADRFELTSRNVQMASAGFQIEPFSRWFVGLDVYGGRFINDWDFDLTQDDIDYAVSLSLGSLTLLGPVELILSRSTLNRFNAEIQVGFRF